MAVAAVVAGCGGGSGGGTTSTTQPNANATPTPTPSGVGVGVGAISSGTASGRAAGKISHGSVGTIVHQRQQGISKSSAGTITKGPATQVIVSKQAQQQAQQQAQKAAQERLAAQKAAAEKAAQERAAAQKAAEQKAAAQQRAAQKKTPPPPSVSTPKTTTTTKTTKKATGSHKTIVHTVTKTQVKTVVRTVTVNPNVPAGAFLPSKHAVLAQQSFTVAGSNVVCELSSGAVRCAILRRVWAAPVQPTTCKGSWGDTIALPRQGLPAFVCGGSNPLSLNAPVIPVGYDDKLGDFTCQVRSFGVDCFSPGRSGFLLSRTGYAFY